VSARLIAATPIERLVGSVREDYYRFNGFVSDALALRAIALVHVPAALPAIDQALKLAGEK
jgi:hypothetical protein